MRKICVMATVIATMVFMTACGGNKEEATTAVTTQETTTEETTVAPTTQKQTTVQETTRKWKNTRAVLTKENTMVYSTLTVLLFLHQLKMASGLFQV